LHQKLSKEFIEKHQDKIDWDLISQFQKLPEEFIQKYQNKVCWDFISAFQNLSEKFIEKYKESDLLKDIKFNMVETIEETFDIVFEKKH
jgi:hypothetical protein